MIVKKCFNLEDFFLHVHDLIFEASVFYGFVPRVLLQLLHLLLLADAAFSCG